MAKVKEFTVVDGDILTSHDMACAKLLAGEFGKVFGFHHACITRIHERAEEKGGMSEKDMESLDMHKSCIRALTRITAMAESAVYHESLDFYAIEHAYVK